MAKQIPTGMTPLVCIPTTANIRLSLSLSLSASRKLCSIISIYSPRIAILLLLIVCGMTKNYPIILLVYFFLIDFSFEK